MLPLFRLLRRGKRLRGTLLDPFRWQQDRRIERTMIADFERDMEAALAQLTTETLPIATALARLPFAVRGFGPLKRDSHARAEVRRQSLRAKLSSVQPARVAEPVAAQ
jgi:indolepyruvate ferredoxin oxidoreductase